MVGRCTPRTGPKLEITDSTPNPPKFVAGLAKPGRSQMQISHASYLLADLIRRTDGPASEALTLYKAVTANTATPPDIRRMAEFFVTELSE